MLAYILAIAVAIGSLIIYLMAFFKPNLHRRDDFLWSGVGLFYAFVLWICAGRITGALLLGQTASVLLLGALTWQVVLYRKAIAFPERQAEILSFSVLDWFESKIKTKKPVITTPKTALVTPETKTEVVAVEETKTEVITPETKTEVVAVEETKTPEVVEDKTGTEVVTAETKTENIEEDTKTEERVEDKKDTPTTTKTQKKGFSLGNLIGKISSAFGKKKPSETKKLDNKTPAKSESLAKSLKDEIEDMDDIFEDDESVVENTPEILISEEQQEEKETELSTKKEEIKEIELTETEEETTEIGEIVASSEEIENKKEEETVEVKKTESEDDNPFKELTS